MKRQRRMDAPASTRASILFVLLSILLVLSACGGAQKPLHEPTNRIAGPDGRKHLLTGKASWYGKKFQGRTTASGEPFDMYQMTAAHRTLPFGTMVRVVEPKSKKSVVVRINDRGPYSKGRVIDLSRAAAEDLGMIERGVVPVEILVLDWGG